MASVLCVGQVVQDFVFAIDSMPKRAEKYRASDFYHSGGGPAASAAVTIVKLGGHAKLAARVGDDDVANSIVSELEGFGVDCAHVKRFDGCSSSLSAVLIDSQGERLIINYLDPDLPSNPAWLPKKISGDFNAVLADTRWPEAAEQMLTRAKTKGIPAILDADQPIPATGGLLTAASHIAFSAAGLHDLAGHDRFDQALRSVYADTGVWCCVTLGDAGVFYIEGNLARRMPAADVKAVDTLGAGDVWHGAFTLALAEGRDEVAAIEFASAAAALKVQRRGGRAAIPARDEVNDYMSTHAPLRSAF